MFWRILFFWYNHEISYWILAPFLSEAVEASRCYFLETQECISKIYNLRIPKLLSNNILLTYFNLSELIHNVQFNVRYPVVLTYFESPNYWIHISAGIFRSERTEFCSRSYQRQRRNGEKVSRWGSKTYWFIQMYRKRISFYMELYCWVRIVIYSI